MSCSIYVCFTYICVLTWTKCFVYGIMCKIVIRKTQTDIQWLYNVYCIRIRLCLTRVRFKRRENPLIPIKVSYYLQSFILYIKKIWTKILKKGIPLHKRGWSTLLLYDIFKFFFFPTLFLIIEWQVSSEDNYKDTWKKIRKNFKWLNNTCTKVQLFVSRWINANYQDPIKWDPYSSLSKWVSL